MNPKQPDQKNKKKSPKIAYALLLLLAFTFGWIFGHQDSRLGQFGFTPQVLNKTANQNVDFAIFWRTWDLLQKNYDGQLDWQKMVYGAIKGMTESLGDPYTSFLNPTEANQLEDDLSGTVSGIGAEVGFRNDKLSIIAPIDDSPAKKAGLLAGDVILQIGNEKAEGMDINTAVSKIRGPAGSKVKLTIERNGQKKEFEITREKITVKSVKSEIKPGNIGYVEITRFDDTTTTQLRGALDDFVAKDVKKVILDLRDNPGGYLNESVTVASEFIDKGIIVAEKRDVDGKVTNEYKATGGGKMTTKDIKLVVLVNGGSASAAEIVAGAIKDLGRGTLIGEKTFGKGSVQEIEDLGQGAKLRITVAHWYTPKGKNIAKEGIAPDVEIKMSEADINAGKDPQLDRALEFLK